MYSISKEFSFSAAHHLEGLPEDHPCSRVHGHNYKVRITLTAWALNKVGFILDYRKMDTFKTWIDLNLDHRDLNTIFNFNPTAEALAAQIYTEFRYCLRDELQQMDKEMRFPNIEVAVSETDKTWAVYTYTAPKYSDNLVDYSRQ